MGIIIFFTFFHKTVEAPKMQDELEQPKQELSVTESSKQIRKEGYEVDFKFPVTGSKKINDEIQRNVDDLISSFEEQAQEFLPNTFEDRDYTFIANYESHLGAEYNTFVFLMSIDFGGAHPNHFYKTLTFDGDENVVSLENILTKKFGNTDSINKISEISRQRISSKLGENTNKEMLEDGTEPAFDNFKNFYIEGETIVFLFEPYAVAPYAYSTQEAKINFSELMI